MLAEAPRNEEELPRIAIELLWQHTHGGVWWAILETGERVRLIEPWEVHTRSSILDETRRDEDRPSRVEIEILWQHTHDGVWWAVLDAGERVRLVEPWSRL